MTTAAFFSALRAHANLPLRFRAGRDRLAAGYHLTEVKRVAYETMDCGAVSHGWRESHFELWVPAARPEVRELNEMSGEKFLRIVTRVEASLPLDDKATARIHTAFADQVAALYDIESVTLTDGMLWVDLVPDRTRCKAAERRGRAQARADGDDAGGASALEGVGSSCGCSPRQVGAPAAVCCA